MLTVKPQILPIRSLVARIRLRHLLKGLASLSLVAFGLSLTGCAGNPATGNADLVLMSENREISIGSEMHEKMMAEGAAYDDPELQAYVDRIGQELAEKSDRPDLQYTFTVLDSSDINAFATPGGFIYVNRGLLAYLDTEDELAGVLAHEIGHVTARHAVRQNTANITNQVLATTAYILTGSSQIAEASSMYGTQLVRGYGREMELEADSLGARYMHKAGYDPEALLDVIGVLKDQELYQNTEARAQGRKVGSYHGVYSTHPRNDARLQQVVATAASLDSDQTERVVPGELRRHIDGLVWGESVQGERAQDRYYHDKLEFSLLKPEGWSVATEASQIVASDSDGSQTLRLTVRRQKRDATPKDVLSGSATGELSDQKELEQAGLKGHTAVASAGGKQKRLAVISYNGLDYFFEGSASDFTAADPRLLEIIESFRPVHPREKIARNPQHVEFMQVPEGATLESLASEMSGPDPVNQLRLLNGLYPDGKPLTGDWIKVVRRSPQPDTQASP